MAQPWELVVIILIRKCQRPDCSFYLNDVRVTITADYNNTLEGTAQ